MAKDALLHAISRNPLHSPPAQRPRRCLPPATPPSPRLIAKKLARTAVLLAVLAAAAGTSVAARAAGDASRVAASDGNDAPPPAPSEALNGPEDHQDVVPLVSQGSLENEDATRFYVSKVLGTTFANVRVADNWTLLANAW
jgi:hypothetical protein